jgi:hypothetical protein
MPRFGAMRNYIEKADARVAEIGPVALAFKTEHPGAGLPE